MQHMHNYQLNRYERVHIQMAMHSPECIDKHATTHQLKPRYTISLSRQACYTISKQCMLHPFKSSSTWYPISTTSM